MTFTDKASKMGREPFVVAELVLSSCANTIRSAPCTADPVVGFECFNTFSTCQDPSNFTPTTKIYRFCEARAKMPVADLDAIPCIIDAEFTAPRLMPSKALGARGSVTLQMKDFTHNDRLIDKYVSTRPYDPLSQGTFAGKLKARNPFYIGRILRTYEGYFSDDGTFDLANARRRDYIVETIDGPKGSDVWTIKGKDILKKVDGDRALCPVASDGELASGITAGATTVTLASGYTAAYSDAHIRIGDEIIDVSTATFDAPTRTWTGVTRAAGGTTATEHSAGDAVQECKTWASVNVIDIVKELLEDFAGIESSYIPYADWTTEKNQSLGDFDLSTIISEPVGVDELLDELTEQVLLDIHFDEVAREIVLRHETQWIADSAELTDSDHLLADSVSVRDRHDLRLSRVWVFYGVKNYAEKLEADNFDLASVRVLTSAESAQEFGDQRVKRIYSRWFDASNTTAANLLTQRLLDRYGQTPREISYALDAKHESIASLGEVVKITTRQDQDETGAPVSGRFQIIEMDPRVPGHRYQYKALRFNGEPQADEYHISVDTTDFNLFDELGQPPDPLDIVVYVDPGVYVTGVAAPAFDTGDLHPDSTVTLVNQGFIYGANGAGGAGGDADVTPAEFYSAGVGAAFPGQPGSSGKDAIFARVKLIVDNTDGEIFGGGGGAGGGGGFYNGQAGVAYGGGGGGGGQGANTASGGAGGDAGAFSGGVAVDGTAGTDGDQAAAGSGGVSSGAGQGGAGGAWGQAGARGEPENETVVATKIFFTQAKGGAGGAGGYAIRKNGNTVTFVGGNTAAKVKGSVA